MGLTRDYCFVLLHVVLKIINTRCACVKLTSALPHEDETLLMSAGGYTTPVLTNTTDENSLKRMATARCGH